MTQPAKVHVGRLGCVLFRQGYHLYVGRARRGLGARLARHLRSDKRLRWHIDYLLAVGTIQEVWVAESAEPPECAWASALSTLPGAAIAMPGFGSSDCRCPGHLVYVPQRPAARDMCRLLPRAAKLLLARAELQHTARASLPPLSASGERTER